MLPSSRAKLVLMGVPKSQVQVSLNGKALPVIALNQPVTALDVSSSMQPNAQNVLQVVSTGEGKAWLEF